MSDFSWRPAFRWRRAIFLALALSSADCMAEPPRVLDRVPLDADAVVAVDSVSRLDGATNQLLTAIELHAVSTLSEALGAMGLRDGLDLTASAAGVFFPGPEDQPPTDRVVLLLPVSDLPLLLKNLGAAKDGAVHRFNYAGGAYFARDLGDRLAAFGSDRDLVEAFDATPGRLPARLASLGTRGRELAERADLLVVADMKSLTPLLAGALGPLLEGAPGAGITDALLGQDPRRAFATELLQRVGEQADTGMLTAQVGPLGLRLDLAAPFRPGTELALLCQAAPAEPSGLLSLPKLPYLFVGALRLSHPGVRSILQSALSPPALGAAEPPPPANPWWEALQALDGVNSASIGVYVPPALLSGILSRTVILWQAPEPGAVSEAFGAFVRSLDGQEGASGAIEPARPGLGGAGARIEQWSLSAPGESRASPLLFGSEGPKGFLATTGSGGVLTWSRDESLLSSCLGALNAADAATSIESDLMLSQVSALLPRDRVIEWFFDARPLLAQALPMLAIGRSAPPPALPETLPPLGVAIAMSDGAIHAAAFVPAPLIRIAVGVAERAATAQDEQPAPRNGPR